MNPARREEVVARFLGREALRDGPFGLLGIEPTACTPAGVEAALQRQLDRIAAHPDSESADADDVRLVLDTAASELLNPVTRAKWITTLRERPDANAEATSAANPGSPDVNPEPPASRRNGARAPGGPERESSAGDAIVKRALVATGVGLGVLLVLTLGMAWLLSPGRPAAKDHAAAPAPPSSPPAPAGTSAPAAAAAAPEPPAPARARGRSEYADGAHVVRELRSAAADLERASDRSVARFERAFAAGGDWWCRFDSASVRAAADAVVECIYRVSSQPDHAERLTSIILDPLAPLATEARSGVPVPMRADEVWPAAFSAGIVARLHRERDLPPGTAAAIGHAVDRVFRGSRPRSVGELTFEAGVDAALRAIPAAVLAGPAPRGEAIQPSGAAAGAALQRWIEAVSLLSGSDADRRERKLAEALDWVLRSAPEPDADPRVFEAISLLATEVKWRAGGPARPRLIEWFRDPQVSNNDLRALTSAIATRSGAEGVLPSMVLSMSARGDDRAQLRARYASAWGLAEASTRADAAREWVAKARSMAELVPREDELDQLAAAAELAELSREAARIWRGETGPGAGSTGGAAPGPLSVPMPASGAGPNKVVRGGAGSAPTGSVTGEARDGAWAERYLAAERNIPVRLERLAELDLIGPPIGWTDAAVLTEAALFGSPVQVRTAAQRVVSRFIDEPAMVSALLDALPGAPRVRAVSETIARVALTTLPRASDPDWELAARRALVERLLSMLADEGIHGQIEQLAARIAAAYLDAAGEPAPEPGSAASAAGATRGAELLTEAARREAAGVPVSSATRFSLEQVLRRREQRRSQAIGPVQSFVAEQTSLAEVLGCLVAAERSEREPSVAGVLEEMTAARRTARHVLAQIWAAERAIVRLWMIRLTEEESES